MQFKDELIATVKTLTAPGKGILAADESVGTLKKKFDKIELECSEPNRRAYRELLFTTPGLNKNISGVILFQETVYQKTAEGKSFIEVLKGQGIVPGIKVDRGQSSLLEGGSETFTKGFDDLEERAAEFYAQGCRFAKWRNVVKMGKDMPSELSVRETSYTLARYANICQRNGLVPIVEPELLTDGEHTIEECNELSKKVFKQVFDACKLYNVIWEGCLFKPHMITQGAQNTGQTSAQSIAKNTFDVLTTTCPENLGGVFFLSGGQSELMATSNLNEINKTRLANKNTWHLSFSFGRALQNTVVLTWKGKQENVKDAQNVLLHRAEMNAKAVRGEYDAKEETPNFKDESMYEKNYSY